MKKYCLILFLSIVTFAETPTAVQTTAPTMSTSSSFSSSTINQCSDPKELEYYRCSCRAELPISSGGVSSDPLLIGNDYVIFSPTDLSNTSCQGVFRPDPCRPALNGKPGFGKYACALITINGSDITVK